MTNKYGARHWGLVSSTAGEGKSTFIAANARTPIYCIDSDGRFGAVEGLSGGEVIYAVKTGLGYGRTGSIDLMNQAEDAILLKGAMTVAVDCVTKIYSYHARRASAAGRLTQQERDARGFNKQKAADMVDKSNIMTALATLPLFGADTFYTWHKRKSIDVQGGSFDKIERDRISPTELETLMASINVRLLFFREGKRFGVTVEYCRDRNGRPSNKGFTIYDTPGNYWRGGAQCLERLMYTSFESVDEAVKWGMKRLGNDDPGEIKSLYEFVKSEQRPKTQSQMAVAWIEHVDDALAGLDKKEPVVVSSPPLPQKEPIPSPPPPAPEQPEQDFQPPPLGDGEPLFPEESEQLPEPVPVAVTESETVQYGDGSEVDTSHRADVLKYQSKFNKFPADYATLDRAIKGAESSSNGW